VKKNDEVCCDEETSMQNLKLTSSVKRASDAKHWTENEVLSGFKKWMLFVLNQTTTSLPRYVKERLKDDLLQEARIALLLCWRDYQKKKATCEFTTYAFMRVRGAVVDAYRQKRYATALGIQVVSYDAQTEEPQPVAREQLATEDNVIDLVQAIEQLDNWERNLLNLHYADGETLKEIGARANVSESRACQLHTKIISKLRALM
jgi:RNA polymerase sigma factor (sigma-70 family)